MKAAIWTVVTICLATSAVHYSQQPGQAGQEDKTQHPLNQQKSTDAIRQEEMKFKLLIMTNGVTKSGATWGGRTYETPTHTKVNLTIVHLDSREGAKKEYDEWLKRAARIIHQGKVQDKPATKPATMEDRAEIIVPATRVCKEATTIIATAGSRLRIIQSCSSEAAIEFEKGLGAVRARVSKMLSGSNESLPKGLINAVTGEVRAGCCCPFGTSPLSNKSR